MSRIKNRNATTQIDAKAHVELKSPSLVSGGMAIPTKRLLPGHVDAYRFLLDHAPDWTTLFELAEQIYQDRRLTWPDKDRLFSVLDSRERAMGGTAVRRPQHESCGSSVPTRDVGRRPQRSSLRGGW